MTDKCVSVRLPESDWRDLIHFVDGDIHNMPYGDPIAEQMCRILEVVRAALVRAKR